MTTAGWVFLTVSWVSITVWCIYCFQKVFEHEGRKKPH